MVQKWCTPLRTLYRLFPIPNVLVAVSKGIQAVKLCFSIILQFLRGCHLTQVDQYNDYKKRLLLLLLLFSVECNEQHSTPTDINIMVIMNNYDRQLVSF